MVNDIVVECGNARYQDVIDRFTSGDSVPDRTLRQVWQNTTVANAVWDRSVYEDFFRAVRILNASLPKDRQVRVLLGDPPIDWDTVHIPADLRKWLVDRDGFPASLIRREVLDRRRHALVVYGDMHFQRRDILLNFGPSSQSAQLLVMRLEAGGAKVFSVRTETTVDLTKMEPDVVSWPKPSLVRLHGTDLGAADFAAYLPTPSPRFASHVGGPDLSAPLPRAQWQSLPMENQFDALLYLGPPTSMTTTAPVSSQVCTEPGYVPMRLERISLAGASSSEIDRFKQICRLTTPK